MRAVIDVESRGGFLPDKRPKILFERHYFHRLSGGSFSAAHPDISHPVWGGYGAGGAAQYDRLNRAITLNRNAALRSASWGSFQIMGDNCKMVGFVSVEDFVAAMVSSGEVLRQWKATGPGLEPIDLAVSPDGSTVVVAYRMIYPGDVGHLRVIRRQPYPRRTPAPWLRHCLGSP